MHAAYCTRHPYVLKPGYDVYGMAFPTDQAKTKKERELIKQQERAAKDSTPASQNSDPQGGTQDDSQSAQVLNGINKLQPQSKGANYIPWHTCPRCKRSLLITRFAQHLEKCLGISGRQSSRNAMAKLSGQNGSMASTPMGSRPGTPAPGTQAEDGKGRKREREDDDGDELDDVPLKKVKKRQYVKKADRERLAAQTSSETLGNSQSQEKSDKEKPDKEKPDKEKPDKEKEKEKDKGAEKERIVLKMKPSATATPTKEGTPAKRPPKPGGEGHAKENGKREREKDKEGDAEGTPKKKMKVANETASASA